MAEPPADAKLMMIASQANGGASVEPKMPVHGHITAGVPFWKVDLRIHVYRLNDEGAADEMAGTGDEEGDTVACRQWILPAKEFDGLWGSLYFDSTVKDRLLHYSSTAMLFSDKRVDQAIISCNRVVLLHGPPGTGKTTLCKALAQKLAIRLSHRYSHGQLLEINSHSLFSKWFSESGKLIQKLFEKIQEMVEDRDSLVCVLIDEVESLAAARQSAGSEPTDSIRAVNALLTQLDRLKNYENVLVLTTSNITEAIDLAFVDRADIKQYIGLPNVHARYEILRSCVTELARVGIISDCKEALLEYHALSASASASVPPSSPSHTGPAKLAGSPRLVSSLTLLRVATECEGMSGRSLRKLPFQAHAFFVQAATAPLASFMQALEQAVNEEAKNRAAIRASNSGVGSGSGSGLDSGSGSGSGSSGDTALHSASGLGKVVATSPLQPGVGITAPMQL